MCDQSLDLKIVDAIKLIMNSTDKQVTYEVSYSKDDVLWPYKKKIKTTRMTVSIVIEDREIPKLPVSQ